MMYVLALCVGIPASRLAVEHAFYLVCCERTQVSKEMK